MRMFNYTNTGKTVLNFRAHNSKGEKAVFELKPGDEMESDRKVTFSKDLKLVGKGKSKKNKGD